MNSSGSEKHVLAVSRLVRASEIGSVRKRRNAVFHLSEVANRDDFDAFSELAATDSDPQVRAFALRGLARTGAPGATSEICKALEDPDRFVKISALREIQSELTGEDLALVVKLLDAPDPALRAGAASAIGNSKSRVGLPALAKCLDDPKSAVRTRVIEAMVKIAEPESMQLLEARKSKEGWFGRKQIDRAISEIRSSN